MTDMDYEKKYNEAMLRADEAVQNGCLDKNIFDVIFPPEESEDERIRKELCSYLLGQLGRQKDNLMDAKFNEWFAWLEKQKELENTSASTMIPSCWVKDPDKCPEFCVRSHCLGCPNYEQKEQKPCGCVNVESEYDNGWRDGHKAGLKDAKMQKPIQSDDEKEYVRVLKSLISDFIRDNYKTTDISFYQKIYDWLDGRHIEQKPVMGNGIDVIKTSALLAADRLASAEMTGRLKERSEILDNPT